MELKGIIPSQLCIYNCLYPIGPHVFTFTFYSNWYFIFLTTFPFQIKAIFVMNFTFQFVWMNLNVNIIFIRRKIGFCFLKITRNVPTYTTFQKSLPDVFCME